MLARGGGRDDEVGVAARGRGDQHGVHVVAAEDLGRIGGRDRCLQAFGQARSGALDRVRDRDQRPERNMVDEQFGVAGPDAAGAE